MEKNRKGVSQRESARECYKGGGKRRDEGRAGGRKRTERSYKEEGKRRV